MNHFDVIIVGAGPVGAMLALALPEEGLRIGLLEAKNEANKAEDTRTLALSYGSKLILERLNIWQQLFDATPIYSIHISQRGAWGRAILKASEVPVPALGYVVGYQALQNVLQLALQRKKIEYVRGAEVNKLSTARAYREVTYFYQNRTKTATSQLVVLADGGRSLRDPHAIDYRQRNYHQSALVANVKTNAPHQNRAFERFTAEGPVALLPIKEGYALVLVGTSVKISALLQLDDVAFLDLLLKHFGERAGSFIEVSKRASFPLSLSYTQPVTAERLVLIGNAAQTLHPVAGQGFNLGIRDAYELSLYIAANTTGDVGSQDMLKTYGRSRKKDASTSILFTDTLVRLFSNNYPLLSLGRSIGLSILDNLPQAKRYLSSKMMLGN